MKLAAVIGSPIAHSKSSLIFNTIFSRLGMSAFYLSVELKPMELESFVRASAETFTGYNVTSPHKVSIMKYLDFIVPEASQIGSVNLVRIEEGKTTGYNVDIAGIAAALTNSSIDFNAKDILIAGSGGIFRTVAYYIFRNFVPASVYVMVRNMERARKELADYIFGGSIKLVSGEDAVSRSYDILINCTPLGTYPDITGIPFPEKLLGSAAVGIDVVYNPPITRFLGSMASNGAKIVTGRDLFVYQAIESIKILFGISAKKDEILGIIGGLSEG
ncbi:MAG: shikimate dehydrogenase family protein [Thermoplasmataceae archaeon]